MPRIFSHAFGVYLYETSLFSRLAGRKFYGMLALVLFNKSEFTCNGFHQNPRLLVGETNVAWFWFLTQLPYLTAAVV
jgi:hypothetical protein